MVNGSAIMYFQPDNGDYSYITIDPPGWVFVGYGLNEKGIAVTTNAGAPCPDSLIGLNPNLMLRTVMEHAATLEEAVALFEEFSASGHVFGPSGAIVHIVDFNQSTMAKIQVRTGDIDVTYGQPSALWGELYRVLQPFWGRILMLIRIIIMNLHGSATKH